MRFCLVLALATREILRAPLTPIDLYGGRAGFLSMSTELGNKNLVLWYGTSTDTHLKVHRELTMVNRPRLAWRPVVSPYYVATPSFVWCFFAALTER